METIHLKLVDPVGQAMLQNAARLGLPLSWERSERLQPQDGFLRLGLSCPLDCLRGPCRIDPFGRGPEEGICGLDRNTMAASSLLRYCQRGALEALAWTQKFGHPGRPHFPGSIAKLTDEALDSLGLPPFSEIDSIDPALLPLNRSTEFEELVCQALRAALYCLGLLGQFNYPSLSGPGLCQSGYGVISGGGICIGLSGIPSAKLIEGLAREVSDYSEPAPQLVALGGWLPLGSGFVPLASSSGTAELLLSSGSVHLLVAGADTQPALIRLCRQLEIPVIGNTDEVSPPEILAAAHSRYQKSPGLLKLPDPPPARNFRVCHQASDLVQLLNERSDRNICLVAGSDNPQTTLGKLPQEVHGSLAEEGMIMCGWGDAAWWIMNSEQEPGDSFITSVDQSGPIVALQGIADAGRLDRLAGVCFTSLGSCLELATALGLAALGCRVCIATPIPILGSEEVCGSLETKIQANGGDLYYVDQPPETRELVEWIAER